MQINFVSDPIYDETSGAGKGQRWFPALWLKTAKKGYSDIVVWKAGYTEGDKDEAERQGFLYLIRYLDRVFR